MDFIKLYTLAILFSFLLTGCPVDELLEKEEDPTGRLPTHSDEIISRSPDHLEYNVQTNTRIVITGTDSIINEHLDIDMHSFDKGQDCWMEYSHAACSQQGDQEGVPKEIQEGTPVAYDEYFPVVRTITNSTATFTPERELTAGKNYIVHLFNDSSEFQVYWTFSTFDASGFNNLSYGSYTVVGTGTNVFTFNEGGLGTIYDGEGTDDLTWEVNAEDQLVVTTNDFAVTFTMTSGTPQFGSVKIYWDDAKYGVLEETGTIEKM